MVRKAKLKIDRERNLVKQEGEINEYLDATGQEDEEKAAKWVIETEKKKEKEQSEEEAKQRDIVEKAVRFTRKEYVFKLAKILYSTAQAMDVPSGYHYKVNYNDEKLNLMIHCPGKKVFGRGIKPCGEPLYDLNAIKILVEQCENTIDKLEKRGQFREGGIILPDGVK